MKRLVTFLALAFLAFPNAALVANDSITVSPRPNILYFYVDDMGWGSIGPNGQANRMANNLPYVRTPNIDRLAKEGINFTRGYGCHVCSPARSSQQTGFHQGHTFADRNDPNNAKKAIRADDITMGDALSKAGYVTGYWGKWGYGGSKSQDNPVIENIETLPTSHGYQHVLAELHHVRAHTFFQPTLWHAPATGNAVGGLELVPNSLAAYQNQESYPNTPALQDHANYPSVAYCDDAYSFAALDFVRKQGQNYNRTGQPFLGLLAVQIPHAPFGEVSTLPNWDAAYAKDRQFAPLADQTRQWAAMVTRMDAHLGNIIDALEDPNNDGDTSDSIANNTLVIFQSDNGGPSGRNNIELDANGGLNGNKGKIQEGGIRVPLVMRWPAKINGNSRLAAGTDCDKVVDVTDLLPTFCELAGADIPLGLDGVSIASMLTGTGTQRHREFIIHEASNGQSIIRGKHKLIRGKKASLQLYDLDQDPSERNNIASDHPEMVEQLSALLLGERVTEPKGFANTYHQWKGDDGDDASDSNNWSDYVYSNQGVTYMADDGAPRLSWTARMENTSEKQPNQAVAQSDLEFLALEIRGNGSTAKQSLVLKPKVKLTGRNEIRLNQHSELIIENGTISSLRWIDIFPLAKLQGNGSIQATVYNNGQVKTGGENQASLRIDGDFHQSESAILNLRITNSDEIPLDVSGTANLEGKLELEFAKDFRPSKGSSIKLIRARELSGQFQDTPIEAVSSNRMRYRIRYSKTEVALEFLD